MGIFTYLFTPSPGATLKFYLPVAILAAILIVGSVTFSVIYKKRRKYDFAFKRLFRHVSSRAVTMGILLVVSIAIRHENIPYFSMRIWTYVIGLITAYLAYRYIKAYKVKYPLEKENAHLRHKAASPSSPEAKYLPNKNKRK
ncbi:MAG: hypothetical protein ABIH78_02425 [Candidatus Peregrinibacteria bacterium]